MLGNDAVEEVVKLLNATPLTDFTGRAYYYEKKDNVGGEYIVVNHLPFIHEDDVCTGTVNINIHVPKLKTNEPDTYRLTCLAREIVELFPKDTYINGAYYEFVTDSRPVKDADDTYYINLEIEVTFNNLN